MLKGMAEGARVNFDDLLFLNVVAEISFRCTAIAATGDETVTGEPILAMNADETKGTEKYKIMLDFNPIQAIATRCALWQVFYITILG